ncbi:hypothetical protein ACRALDRAFT_1037317 [Sodiomyces alcalophilus JCM 7366]|uniref:uncharacterized protein n=1 Tax=Sodiomyces alcalophilus JCM 7366 TaxID=591952 RepID=UPI0039B6E1CD
MPRRPIRIGSLPAGSDQLYRLAKGNVDAITATHQTESALASQAIQLPTRPDLGYDPSFLDQLAWNNGDTARLIAQRRIKVVHDGGALNPRGLAEKADAYFKSLGISDVTVAWVEGDNVTEQVRSGGFGTTIRHVDRPAVEVPLPSHGQSVLSANVSTGQAGIVRALEAGADVVVCGRCAEASPVLGLASWWHGWDARDHDRLAGALMAGHLIDFGRHEHVMGGGNVGQDEGPRLCDLGFPVAEIRHDGDVVIAKVEGSGGLVTVDTCKARLLYGIRGPFHGNPDVVADTRHVNLEQIDRDRVRLSGIKGLPPPLTVKLDLVLQGGKQGPGGLHVAMDQKTLQKPYLRHLPVLVPQNRIPLRVQIVGGGKVINVPAKEARDCREVPAQPNYEPRRAKSYGMVGKIFPPGTLRRPLGHLVLATASSGGTGGNGANVGFWVSDQRAWEWLCGFMTSARLKELLGDAWDERYVLERCEFPNLWAVHFAAKEIGRDGVSMSGGLDRFGEYVSEMLRGRVVEMPAELVQAETERRKTRPWSKL